MVDLHCHILPGIDDGPATVDESRAMAEFAVSEGITHVVATPHSSGKFKFDFAKISRLREELQSFIGDRLQLATGCDFHLDPENIAAVRKNPKPYCINQRDYLLVEFNEFSIPEAMDQTLHQLQLAGLRPIVTHPERNAILRSHPDRLVNWIRRGCYAQITAGALTGDFGNNARLHAVEWLSRGLVHFVSSDAHNITNRPLLLRPAYDLVLAQLGKAVADALFLHNPLAAFEGQTLPYIPEVPIEMPRRKKRFFFF
jgi:protein-tyrosine phosphatase